MLERRGLFEPAEQQDLHPEQSEQAGQQQVSGLEGRGGRDLEEASQNILRRENENYSVIEEYRDS